MTSPVPSSAVPFQNQLPSQQLQANPFHAAHLQGQAAAGAAAGAAGAAAGMGQAAAGMGQAAAGAVANLGVPNQMQYTNFDGSPAITPAQTLAQSQVNQTPAQTPVSSQGNQTPAQSPASSQAGSANSNGESNLNSNLNGQNSNLHGNPSINGVNGNSNINSIDQNRNSVLNGNIVLNGQTLLQPTPTPSSLSSTDKPQSNQVHTVTNQDNTTVSNQVQSPNDDFDSSNEFHSDSKASSANANAN